MIKSLPPSARGNLSEVAPEVCPLLLSRRSYYTTPLVSGSFIPIRRGGLHTACPLPPSCLKTAVSLTSCVTAALRTTPEREEGSLPLDVSPFLVLLEDLVKKYL